MDFLNKNWFKYAARPAKLHQTQQYAWALGEYFSFYFKVSPLNMLGIFREHDADQYFVKEEWEKMATSFRRCLKNKAFLKSNNEFILTELKKIEKRFKFFNTRNFSCYSSGELLDTFHIIDDLKKKTFALIAPGFVCDDLVIERAHELLARRSDSVENDLNIFSTLTKPIYLNLEEVELSKIALIHRGQEELLNCHWHRYQYIPCYDLDVEPYPLSYFQERLQELVIAVDPHKTFTSFQRQKNILKKLVKRLSLSASEKLFFDYFRGFYWLKDQRSHFRSIINFYSRPFYQELSRRCGADLNYFAELSREETERVIKTGKRLPLNNREEFVYIKIGQEEKLIFKPTAIRVIRKLEALVKEMKSISGTSAFPGIGKGRVKIINSPKQIDRFKEGDVLVCPMTRPDYVHYMKLAAAFITDEGGILCHAAIIARELRKPCIIGTKIATQVLKDGDIVEVDADKGMVRILKK